MLRHIDGPSAEHLTLRQTSLWLGVPQNTLKKWADAGLIPQPRYLQAGKKLPRYSWRVVLLISLMIEFQMLLTEPEKIEE